MLDSGHKWVDVVASIWLWDLHNLWISIIKLAITFRICRHCRNGALGHIAHCDLQLVELIRNWNAGLPGSCLSSKLSLGSMAIGQRKNCDFNLSIVHLFICSCCLDWTFVVCWGPGLGARMGAPAWRQPLWWNGVHRSCWTHTQCKHS